MHRRFSLRLLSLAVAVLAALPLAASTSAVTLRIVSYNIAADIDGYTAPRPGLDTVLEAIGEQNVNGVAQRPDVVGLEETTSNTATLAPLIASLNTYYGAAVYAASDYQATEVNNNPTSGNGPNAVIYNTQTLVLLESVGVGTPTGSTGNGESRQIARYEFQPVGGTAASAFYVYVSHMKSSFSGTTAAVEAARALEAQILRADSATLPADACILYTGDFNLDGSAEAAYQTLTATGPGQGIDPLNFSPQDDTEQWDTAAFVSIDTESATALQYRDDIQFISENVFDGAVSGGLQYIDGSYRAFGNNGTTAFKNSVNATTNTALDNLQGPITAATALAALTTASDHLPVVADYSIGVAAAAPVPVITSATSLAAQVGAALSYQIVASNDPTGYTANGLPGGVTLDPVSGLITGSPTAAGTFAVTLGAVNASGTGTATLTLTVASVLPSVSVTVPEPVARAADGTVGSFLLTRTGDMSAPLVVTFALKGTAQNGIDYYLLPLTKKIKAGKASRRINIAALSQPGAAGSARLVKMVVKPAAAYTVGYPSKGKVLVLPGE